MQHHMVFEEDKVPVDVPVLFQHRDGPILPALKQLVHQYSGQLDFRQVTVDKGAIPFILGGANIMCPGLTKNPGSVMPPDDNDNDTPGLAEGQGVVIYAEGKEYAIAVGVMTMSSADVYVVYRFVSLLLLCCCALGNCGGSSLLVQCMSRRVSLSHPTVSRTYIPTDERRTRV